MLTNNDEFETFHDPIILFVQAVVRVLIVPALFISKYKAFVDDPLWIQVEVLETYSHFSSSLPPNFQTASLNLLLKSWYFFLVYVDGWIWQLKDIILERCSLSQGTCPIRKKIQGHVFIFARNRVRVLIKGMLPLCFNQHFLTFLKFIRMVVWIVLLVLHRPSRDYTREQTKICTWILSYIRTSKFHLIGSFYQMRLICLLLVCFRNFYLTTCPEKLWSCCGVRKLIWEVRKISMFKVFVYLRQLSIRSWSIHLLLTAILIIKIVHLIILLFLLLSMFLLALSYIETVIC